MIGKKELEDIDSAIEAMAGAWVGMSPERQVAATAKVREGDPVVSFWLGSDYVRGKALEHLLLATMRDHPVVRLGPSENKMLATTAFRCVKELAGKKPGANADMLGRGAYGMVFPHPTKKDRVVKVIRLNFEDQIKMVLTEAELMKAAAAIGVSPKVYGISACVSGGQRPLVLIEMAALKTTFAVWANEEKRSESEVRRMLGKIEAKTDALHKIGIMHNDLHGKNVMIDAKGQPFLVDFGISSRVGAEDDGRFPAIKREKGLILHSVLDTVSETPSFLKYAAGGLAAAAAPAKSARERKAAGGGSRRG
jgi:tRNA A-37 threonylcarbamoyl transferase component Bud32